jgi:sulfate transport system ATP-binding protein
MSFLGPVTKLAGQLVRPHDIEVLANPARGAISADVERLQRVGFEVRAEMTTADGPTWVQLTRGQSESIDLATGSRVWLLAAPNSTSIAAPS